MKEFIIIVTVIAVIATVAFLFWALFTYILDRKEARADAAREKEVDRLLKIDQQDMRPEDWANYDYPVNINA